MTAPKIDFALVHEHALAYLPRVLAGMGFSRVAGPMPRGGVAGFEPRYEAAPGWRKRIGATDTHSARGMGQFTAAACDALDRDDAIQRERIAARNRERNLRPAYLCASPDLAIRICTVTGAWASVSGGANGDDLVSLGSLRWNCKGGPAAFRIARLAGLDNLPVMPDA
jgi:hypothetical protein